MRNAGDIESAASLYERALELKDRIVGSDQEELAEMQFGVAGLYIDWGNFSRARELLSMCIGTFKRKKGARLAVAYETGGPRRGIFRPLPRTRWWNSRAPAKIWETCGPERAVELATNMEYRAVLLDQLKKKGLGQLAAGKAAEARAAAS